jgi:Zn-dependent protease with chaperone function
VTSPSDRPLLDLPSVDLPPPEAGAARSRSLARRALVSLALLLGVFVVAIGILGGLVGLDIAAWQSGRVQFGLVFATFAVAIALGRGLMASLRRPPEPADEVFVSAAEEPELHAEIHRLAAAAGARPPDRVVVVADVNAYVREFGPLLGLMSGERTLAIGTPLLDALDVSELRAVLAHELGHLAGGDTRLGPLLYRTDQALMSIVQSLGNGATGAVFEWYWRFQHRVSASVRREQEVVADRAAVRVAGRQAAADALRDLDVAARADDVLKHAYLVPLLRRGNQPDDLLAGWRAVLADPVRVAALAADAEEDVPPVDPWASHPPTHERIRRIAAIGEDGAIVRDTRPASMLLRRPDDWARAALDRWMTVVGIDRKLPTVSWDAWGDIVAADEQRTRADAVDRALTRMGMPAGVAGISQAMSSGLDRDLAAALVSGGWRANGPDQRRTMLQVALTASAATEAVEAGARWGTSWSGDTAIRSADGRLIDVSALAAEALEGRWDPLLAATNCVVEPLPQATPAAGGARNADADATLPRPPTPPFAAAKDAQWRWEVDLPGRSGAIMRFSDTELGIGDWALRYDNIGNVTTRVTAGNELRVTITVTATDWTPALTAKPSASGAEGNDLLAAVNYLWAVSAALVGPRWCDYIIEKVRGGNPVTVAGLVLSIGGVAPAGHSDRVVPWEQVGDPIVSELVIVLPTPAKPLTTSVSAADAYLLDSLIPLLRTHFADA